MTNKTDKSDHEVALDLGIDANEIDALFDEIIGMSADPSRACANCGTETEVDAMVSGSYCSSACRKEYEVIRFERANALYPILMRAGLLSQEGATEMDKEDGAAYMSAIEEMLQEFLREDGKRGRAMPQLTIQSAGTLDLMEDDEGHGDMEMEEDDKATMMGHT